MADQPPPNDAPELPSSGRQVEHLRDALLPVPETSGSDANEPQMPFVTNYVLTRQQEDAMCQFADKRLIQLEDQTGRTGQSGNSGSARNKIVEIEKPDSFFGKRKKFSWCYYGHVDYRKKKDTIYEQSNLTASLSQRITMQMIARAIRFFFGEPDDTDWFSTLAVGEEDQTKSDKIKKHSRFKVDQCGVKLRLIEALEYAFIRGEAVVKPTHQRRFQIYKRKATVLMGGIPKDGTAPSIDEPLLDAHGDYIVQGDVFVPEMKPIEEQSPGLIARIMNFIRGPEPGAADVGAQVSTDQPVPDMTAELAQQMQPTGRTVLKRDGVTALPANPIWTQKVITRELVTFEGPEAEVVYFEDFLCPETATDIQRADMIAHLYDMDVMKVAAMFRGQFGEGDEAIANIRAAVNRLRVMIGDTNLPKAAATQPREDFKETDTTGADAVPICQIAECYLTYDADGDGIQEEIMLIMDRRNKAPIYYEYLANVTVRGLRPFFVVRPMPVDQRWYGMGSMELFDPEAEFVDLQINRYNFAKSKAGRIDFWNPAATIEGSRDPNLKLNHGRTYTLRDGKKKEDAYDFAEVPFDGKELQFLLNLFMQMMQLKSGVVNSGDQEMSGLPSSDLATGINEVRESGEELFSRILSHLFPGVKDGLKTIIDIIYANMNRLEVFTYFNGEADEILSLSPDEVRDMSLNVTLELSRTQQRKAVEMGTVAQAAISWFYSMREDLQARLAPYVRKQLKAFGVVNADAIIEPTKPHRTAGPIDKPSSVANALAALIKAGVKITTDDINAVLVSAGLPPLAQAGSEPAAPPPAPPTPPGGGENEEPPALASAA